MSGPAAGREGRRLHRAGGRAPQHHHLRHGRDQLRRRRHPRRAARAHRGQGDGLRPAGPRADDRHPHHRRRRRLHRARELGRHPAGRARERRAPTPGRSATGAAGEEPTITDANLLLGRLNPAGLLGVGSGRAARPHPRDLRQEDRRASRASGPTRWPARSCGWPTTRWPGAIRLVSLQRGHDPRDFVLFAFGGAGPLHAVALARELAIPRVLVPARPGITSALGCLVADVRHDFVKTVNQGVLRLDLAEAHRILAAQVEEGRRHARLRRRGGRDGERPARGGHAVRRADPRADGARRAGRLRARGSDARVRDRVLGALRGGAARDARPGREPAHRGDRPAPPGVARGPHRARAGARGRRGAGRPPARLVRRRSGATRRCTGASSSGPARSSSGRPSSSSSIPPP